MRVADNGNWSIAKNTTSGNLVTLASGTHPGLGLNSWHTFKLGFSGDQITATLDGGVLGTVTDASYLTGQVGFGVVGYQTDQFDNLSITPNAAGSIHGILKGVESGRCLDVPNGVQTNGTLPALWDCTGGSNQSWTATPAGQLIDAGGKCLDVVGGGTADGTKVEIYDCNNTGAQQWTVDYADGSVVNPQSGRCLDVTAHATADASPVEIWGCNGGANQKWARGSTSGFIKGAGSGRCVDVPGGNQANGTVPALWDCNGATNQTWVSTASNQLQIFDHKCLDASGGGVTDGTPIVLWDCNGGANQQWTVGSNGSIIGLQSGKCLDVTGAATADASPLELWTCTGASNQVWSRA